MLALLLKGIIG
jgi:hypothetical protein